MKKNIFNYYIKMSSSSEIVYEERNSSVGLGETIRFRIPPSVALLNAKETYLKFNMVVGTKGKQENFTAGDEADEAHYFPWTMGPGAGANLIRNITIRSLDGGVIFEQITDYNRLNRVLCNYVENSTQKNLKRLYEGGDTDYVRQVNTLTRRTIDGAGASTAGETQENMEVEVIVPLRLSGILNSESVYPNVLAPLEVEILLEEDVYKVIHAQGNELGGEAANFEGSQKTYQNIVGGYSDTTPYKVDGTISGAQTSLTILKTNDGGDNFYTGDLNATSTADFPFYNGQVCTVETSSGDTDIVINSVELGTANRLQLNFASTTFTNTTANPKIYVKVPTAKPTITLSELQLVCGVVTPTQQQLAQLEAATKQGYEFKFKSYMDFPVNNYSGGKNVSNLINCNYRFCKSILSFWEDVGINSSVNEDGLLVPIDESISPSTVQYRLGGLLTPNRPVDISRYARLRNQQGGWGAVATKELEQAIMCCGFQVRDLSNVDGCFLTGRGLVPVGSGATYDMSDNEETRILLKWNAQTQSLLQHNYVCYLKVLKISGSGKMIIE